MFKSILVPTDGSEFSQIALDFAIDLACKYDGHIKLLHVIDIRAIKGPFIRDISASMGLIPVVDYQPKIQQILEERGKIALDEAEKKCKTRNIHCYRVMTTGIISQEIKKTGHTVDIIVMGQRGEHAEFGSSMLGSTLEATVRESNKPILVTPQKYQKIKHVLMAYDGSDVANDALRVCRNLCMELSLPATILTVTDHLLDGEQILKEAREYMDPYNLNIKYQLKMGQVPNAILSSIPECKSDLLIMGAYGRNRFFEIVLGSNTSYILRKADFPILLSR